MKLEKIEKDMQKTREKITGLQNRLKELEVQKTEQENLQIVQLVRSLRMSPQELKAFLQGTPQPTDASISQYDTEMEDSDDEK